jgi:lipopolysaccharide biosynthesis glycosyltransferase
MHLVYTTLGFDAQYIPCVEFLLDSLALTTKSHVFDFLIICDRKLYRHVISRLTTKTYTFPIKYMIVEDASNSMHASINKLKVIQYPFINEYDNVLFLDCDIITTMDVTSILNSQLDANLLYAFKEKDDIKEHLSMFWSLGKYTSTDLEYFTKNNIYPFNAGCFMFHNGNVIREHFSNILAWIDTYQGPFFYEQSFMNVYFNTRNLINYESINDNNYVMFPDVNKYYGNHIIHFCGHPGNGENKVRVMKKYWTDHIVNSPLMKIGAHADDDTATNNTTQKKAPARKRAARNKIL